MSRAFQLTLICAAIVALGGIRLLHLQAAAPQAVNAIEPRVHVAQSSRCKNQSILLPPSASIRATLGKYSCTCHNDKLRVAGLMLDKLNHADLAADASTWEKVVQQLRTGAMPPAGRPRPDKPGTTPLRQSWRPTLIGLRRCIPILELFPRLGV